MGELIRSDLIIVLTELKFTNKIKQFHVIDFVDNEISSFFHICSSIRVDNKRAF